MKTGVQSGLGARLKGGSENPAGLQQGCTQENERAKKRQAGGRGLTSD